VSWITLGDAELHRVEELRVRLPFDMFGASDDLIAANADWLRPRWLDDDGTWDMVVQSFIVVADGRVTVVDPCVGNGRPLPTFPIFDNLDTPFIERFGDTGFRPEDVDAVVCTHLHSDHCGWNTVLRDGKYVPTFPNARYYMGWRELTRWDTRRPDYKHIPENEGVFERSVLPVLEAGLVDVIGDTHPVSPSLTARLAHGHTLGHMALELASGGEHGWFTGDAFHHPIELIHPELDPESCEDFANTVITRKRLIDTFIAQGALIIPAHFTEPHAGYLREENGVRTFEPLA